MRKNYNIDSVADALRYHRSVGRIMNSSVTKVDGKTLFSVVTNKGTTYEFSLGSAYAFIQGLMSQVKD